MNKIAHIFLIVLILSLALVNTAYAGMGEPAGGCSPAFELHHFMEHEGDHMHRHIGISQDLNGDGFICVKHLSETKHLHVDNRIPIRG